MTKAGGKKPNKHQKRLAVQRFKKKQERRKLEKFDLYVTILFDQIIERAIVPVLKEHLRFGDVRIQRFFENLNKVERYSGMNRGDKEYSVNYAKAEKMQLQDWAYRKLWDFVVDMARDAVGLMGYGEKRLSTLYDPHLKEPMAWRKLFEKSKEVKGGDELGREVRPHQTDGG